MTKKYCKNCGYDITGGLITVDDRAVCPSCHAPNGHRVTEIQEFGWLPPVDDGPAWKEFIDGFGAAHADDIDHGEAEAILAGEYDELETTDDALLRILKFPLWEQIRG